MLAGGHSLMPLMKLRLAAPSLLVDLRSVPRPDAASSARTASWRIGAMTTHAAVAREAGLGARLARREHDRRPAGPQPRHDRRLARARRPGLRHAGGAAGARGLGDRPRRRPASARSRRPTCSRTTSPPPWRRRGPHRGPAAGDGRLRVRLPEVQPPPGGLGDGGRRRARQEGRRRHRARTCASGSPTWARRRCGRPPPRRRCAAAARRRPIAAAAEQAAEGTEPPADLNASADYKRHLARVLTKRALADAAA